jgi:hypothetical protein
MTCKASRVIPCVFMSAALAAAQTAAPASSLKFEVASIKTDPTWNAEGRASSFAWGAALYGIE